jgi:arylsulfatase A-like enzyme
MYAPRAHIPLVLTVLLAVAACDRPPPRPPAGVVLVLVDALRADRLGCYGYTRRPTSPNLDALAAESTRFADAVSSTPWTLPSMATLFTSLYPSVHGATLASDIHTWLRAPRDFKPVTVLDGSRTTLAEVLRASGFATAGFVQGSYPAPEFGLAQGFERYEANRHPGIRFNVEALLGWLDETRPRRFFAYLHVAEVHSPYTPPAPDPRFSATSPDPASRALAFALDEERARYRRWDFDPQYDGWLDGSWESLAAVRAGRVPSARDVEHLGALYDRGIAYTDHWVGRLLDGLATRGLLDQTAVIVTSDHGDELFEHGRLEHNYTYYEETMRVPLIVRVPDLGVGRVVEQQVGLIDLMPTVLDVLGAPADQTLQGRSLVPLMRGDSLPDVPVLGEASQTPGRRAVRTGAWKYVTGGPEPTQLFDLAADPGERTNACAARADTCAALETTLREIRETLADAAHRSGLPPPPPAEVDAETRERLRRLGYAD